jgi:hypothetical protein
VDQDIAEAILELPVDRKTGFRGGQGTIRDYLHTLLRKVWAEGDGFNGKRPFGNSNWEYDLYIALAKGHMLNGAVFDEDDLLQELPDEEIERANLMIEDVIDYLCGV